MLTIYEVEGIVLALLVTLHILALDAYTIAVRVPAKRKEDKPN